MFNHNCVKRCMPLGNLIDSVQTQAAESQLSGKILLSSEDE